MNAKTPFTGGNNGGFTGRLNSNNHLEGSLAATIVESF
jgi:hypothetical protein